MHGNSWRHVYCTVDHVFDGIISDSRCQGPAMYYLRVGIIVQGLKPLPPPMVGPCGSGVECQSLASILSPSCARPVANG